MTYSLDESAFVPRPPESADFAFPEDRMADVIPFPEAHMAESFEDTLPNAPLELVPSIKPVEIAPKKITVRDRFLKFSIGAHLVGQTFFDEVEEQWKVSDGFKEKSAIVTSATTAAVAQGWDRFRFAEIIGIPAAIAVYKHSGSALEASSFFAASTYVQQYIIGGSWGNAMLRFRETADTFDQQFPVYSEALNEEDNGYIKTLQRQSLGGLGTGNTPFVTAEVLKNSHPNLHGVLDVTQQTSRRIALPAGGIGLVALKLEEKFPSNVVVEKIVSVVENPLTWVGLGFGPLVVGAAGCAAIEHFRSKKQAE